MQQSQPSGMIALLTDYGMLEITGNDAHDFLHFQFISDIQGVSKDQSTYSAWCNSKGLVITTMLVINTGKSVLLICRLNQKDYLLKRLRMFVLHADVHINDVTEIQRLAGIDHAENISDFIKGNSVDAYPLPEDSRRQILVGNSPAFLETIDKLQTAAGLLGQSAWDALTIRSGIPWLGSDNRERFLPQMLNLDKFDALSYQKGCYPGQEVIARLHYRGKVKRRLRLIRSDIDLNEGMIIKTAKKDNAGAIINAAPLQGFGSIALAVIDNDKLNIKLFSGADIDTVINVLPMPYNIYD